MERFLEALEAYVDARIHYAAADHEWRNLPLAQMNELELALTALLQPEARLV